MVGIKRIVINEHAPNIETDFKKILEFKLASFCLKIKNTHFSTPTHFKKTFIKGFDGVFCKLVLS